MFQKLSILLVAVSFSFSAFAQGEFDTDEAAEFIVERINALRKTNNVDALVVNKIVKEASLTQAEEMVFVEKATLTHGDSKLATTGDRIWAAGGTKNGSEVVAQIKNPNLMTTEELANAAMDIWELKNMSTLIHASHKMIGVSVRLTETGKKAYVSTVFGNYQTVEDEGGSKANRKLLEACYTNQNKKLKTPGKKTCKACYKFDDYDKLLKGLYVEDGIIYLKYNNVKALSKLLRGSKDGLAVDIIQKAQYTTNPNFNILNKNLKTVGVLTKTVNFAKMMKKNRAELDPKGKVKNIDTPLGKFPKDLKSEYEMDLLVVIQSSLCKTISRTYTETGDVELNNKLKMLMMPEEELITSSEDQKDSKPFVPVADSATYTFTIPFPKNEHKYPEGSLDPFLTRLEEPNLIVTNLEISSYSSIEGLVRRNKTLQELRLSGIEKPLKKAGKLNLVTQMSSNDSWDLFCKDALSTKYAYLAKMDKKYAIDEINTVAGLSDSLESILEKHRLTKIIMDITYDISGPLEEALSIDKFNEAVDNGDVEEVFKVHKYITGKINEGAYSEVALTQLNLPKKKEFAGIHNNQLVHNYYKNDSVPTQADYTLLKKINASDPSNSTLAYNKLYCALTLDDVASDEDVRYNTQDEIDALYESSIDKKQVDDLNLAFQFKILDVADSLADAESVVTSTIEKIRSFFDLTSTSSLENNLKLSYVFASYEDYDYATSLLEPFIENDKLTEDAAFAYISYCSHLPAKINSSTFSTVMKKAEGLNHDRYCKLIGAPFLPYHVLQNPDVKQHYMATKCNEAPAALKGKAAVSAPDPD